VFHQHKTSMNCLLYSYHTYGTEETNRKSINKDIYINLEYSMGHTLRPCICYGYPYPLSQSFQAIVSKQVNVKWHNMQGHREFRFKSANLRCRSETCWTRLAENTGRKKSRERSPSGHHRTTLSGYIFATKARIDNRKKKTC